VTLPLQTERRWSAWYACFGVGLSLAAASLVVAAAVAPMVDEQDALSGDARRIPPLPQPGESIGPLLAKASSTRLIMPAQVQAAIKDNGAAEKMLARLKLQGVVQIGNESIAYVVVEKEGIKTLRKGDQLLSFTVESVSAGRVQLSYEGIQLELKQ